MIIFLRHNRLLAPFDNYNNLDYKKLISLWKQELSPPVCRIIPKNNILTRLHQLKSPTIYTSTSLRTQQTAEILWFDNSIQSKCLDEIYFDVSTLISSEEYKSQGLSILREKLWKDFFSSHQKSSEKSENVSNRIIQIENIIHSTCWDIIFISHWFFLNLIFLKLILHKNILEDNDQLISFISPIDYCDWFVLDI